MIKNFFGFFFSSHWFGSGCTCPVYRLGSWDTPNCLGSVCPRRPSEMATFSTSDICLKTESTPMSIQCQIIKYGTCGVWLTTLNSHWNLHGTSPFVSQLWWWRCRPAGRQVTKLVPKLHDAFLSYVTQSGKQRFKHVLRQHFISIFNHSSNARNSQILESFQYCARCSPMDFSKCRYSFASAKSCLLWVGSRTKYGTSTTPTTPPQALKQKYHRRFKLLLLTSEHHLNARVYPASSTYMPPSSWGPVFSYILIRREQLYTNIPSRSLWSMFTPNIKFNSFGSFKALRNETLTFSLWSLRLLSQLSRSSFVYLLSLYCRQRIAKTIHKRSWEMQNTVKQL